MEYIVQTENLVKKYGDKTVINNVCIHVKKGEIYGLIGKNGAGKTTLMRVILGLARPDGGNILLYDSDKLDEQRRKIGSLIEAPALYKNVSAFENMKRLSILSPTSDEKINEILNLVGLGDVGKKKVGDFSLGMKQRLGLALTLLGEPDLLILDEPINGLDPAGIKEIRNIIVDLNKKGVTFVISSHLLDELGKIATTYGIVHNGEIEEVTAKDLKEKCQKSIRISVNDAQKAKEIIENLDSKYKVTISDDAVIIADEIKDAQLINKTLITAGIEVFELKVESLDFEDYFIARLGD